VLDLVAELLVLGTQLHDLRVQDLDHVQQLNDDLLRDRVGDGVQVDIRYLHSIGTETTRRWMAPVIHDAPSDYGEDTSQKEFSMLRAKFLLILSFDDEQ
jgi:hypothetical protein